MNLRRWWWGAQRAWVVAPPRFRHGSRRLPAATHCALVATDNPFTGSRTGADIRRSRCLYAFVLLAVGCAGDPLVDQPPVTLQVPIASSTLPNGLTVSVVPNHGAPLVSAVLAVRMGASIEDATTAGYSHMFEHMIFQGSQSVPSSVEFANRLAALGTRSNATTGVDRVTYYFTTETRTADEALGLFADALQRPALLAESLDKERKVVLAEFDLNESKPDFVRYRQVLRALYGDQSTRLDALGSREVVQTVTPDMLRAAHATFYVPNNALLVLSGDLTVDEGNALAQRHFGAWPIAVDPFATRPLAAPTPVAASAFYALEADIDTVEISVAWPGPSARDDPADALAGAVLASVTMLRDHSFRTLVHSQAAYSASLQLGTTRSVGYLAVNISTPPQFARSSLRSLHDILTRLGEVSDVSDEQLAAAKDELFATFLQSSSDATQLPQLLADQWGLTGSVDGYRAYADALYAVDKAAIQAFARRYLRDRVHVGVLSASADNLNALSLRSALSELLP